MYKVNFSDGTISLVRMIIIIISRIASTSLCIAKTCLLTCMLKSFPPAYAGEPQPWLAPDMVLAVRSPKARDSTSAGNNMDHEPGTRTASLVPWMAGPGMVYTSAGNNMDREPGTGDGKPDTHDSAVQCMCVYARLLSKFIYPRYYRVTATITDIIICQFAGCIIIMINFCNNVGKLIFKFCYWYTVVITAIKFIVSG